MKQDKTMVTLYVDKDTVNIYKASLDLYEALKNVLFDLQHGFFGDSPLVSDRQAEIEKALAKAEQ